MRISKVLAATSILVSVNCTAFAVTLTRLSTAILQPIGICYHDSVTPAGQFLVVSMNRDSPGLNKFSAISATGVVSPFGTYSDNGQLVKDPDQLEVKLASIRYIEGQSIVAGGFQLGDVFFGNGVSGEVCRISATGSVLRNQTFNRPAPSFLLLGADKIKGIVHDRNNTIGGCLVVTTDGGQVWKVPSTGAATLLTTIRDSQNQPVGPLEACLIVPNQAPRYGFLAGKILVGVDNIDPSNPVPVPAGMWVVDPSSGAFQQIYRLPTGVLTTSAIGAQPIAAEDLDIIRVNESLHAVDFEGRAILTASPQSGQFTAQMDGDILVTTEFGGFQRIYINGSTPAIVGVSTSPATTYEHVTFAPLQPVPRVTSVSLAPAVRVEGSIPQNAFLVHRDANVDSSPISVNLSFSGSAGYGGDYSVTLDPASDGGTYDPATMIITFSFKADGRSATDLRLMVEPLLDRRYEGNESIVCTVVAESLSGGASARYLPGSPSTASVTIQNSNTAIPQYQVPASYTLYEVTSNVGTGLQNASQALAINDSSVVVGAAFSSAGGASWDDARPFKFVPPVSGQAGSLEMSGAFGQAFALSADGSKVIGHAGELENEGHSGFVWMPPSYPVELPRFGYFGWNASVGSAAYAIAPGNVIVGGDHLLSGTSVGPLHAVAWYSDDSTGDLIEHDLSTLAGPPFVKNSVAYGVNSQLWYVGKSQIQTGSSYHAFRVPSLDGSVGRITGSQDLGVATLVDSDSSEATSINDSLEVVGASHFNTGSGKRYHACLITPGQGKGGGFLDLTPSAYSSIANSIGSLGHVVGTMKASSTSTEDAFIYFNTPLNPLRRIWDLVDPAVRSSWVFSSAEGINSTGWVVGWGYKNGKVRAFVLKPNY